MILYGFWKEGTPSGALSQKELFVLVVELRQELAVCKELLAARDRQIDELKTRIDELEQKNPTTRLDESYSLDAEEKRRGQPSGGKQKSSRRGRITTAEKLAQATVHENILPDGLSIEDCTLKYSRPV